MRMSVPACVLAYPGEERDAMPPWSGRRVVGLPMESLGRQAVDDLERLRDSENCEFLVVPRIAFGWLEASPDLAAHLEGRYTLVDQTPNCAIYSLHRRAGPESRVGEDGLPLPPPHLIRMTAGGPRQALGDAAPLYRNFWRSGTTGFAALEQLLARNGRPLAGIGSVLDFGCGVGRVLRHWHAVEGAALHGCDYNPLLVEWCRTNLGFARFEVNDHEPPLPYPDGELDFVYALSVFSHFDVFAQELWVDELSRIVRPGGLIMFSVPGERWMGMLGGDDRRRFLAGEPVVLQAEQNGTNLCCTLSPEHHVRTTLTRGHELVELAVDGAPDVRQDAVLLRKPKTS
jgi:SAM-dependent methyltransferase